MIYFLINNNYHLDLDLNLAKQLKETELALIQVPYSLKVVEMSEVFSKVYLFSEKISLSLQQPLRILEIQNKISQEVKPLKDDILLVHSDRDLVNQHIIKLFFQARAKVYFVEDGTATMCTDNLVPTKAPVINRFKTWILKNIYNFQFTKIAVYGVETLFSMEDHLFNGAIITFGNAIRRKIPLFKLTPIKYPFQVRYRNGAIFFNQDLYSFYFSEEVFFSLLDDVFDFSKQFSPFYFKFHPSDTPAVKQRIIKLIEEKHDNIIIITESDIAENIVNKYPVQYAISFNSTASLNLISKGIIPIFLNDVYCDKLPVASFIAFKSLLESMGCISPADKSDVKPGFTAFAQSANSTETQTISEILNIP